MGTFQGGMRRVILSVLSASLLLGPTVLSARAQDADELYRTLRAQGHTRLTIGGGNIDVVFADPAGGLDRRRVLDWISTAARAVNTYFGRFPVEHVGILVNATTGNSIGSATTYGFGGSAMVIDVGRNTEAAFKDDWILVHEMTHLALPTVPRRSQWLLEGNATYVEPIARAQAGQLDRAEVWRWAVAGMPRGLPEPGDEGLDHTPTWGRTYWGGAIFWLLADVQIRVQTHEKFGVQEALRAIDRRSGGNSARWSVEEVLAAGDEATGTDVLMALYSQMKATPTAIDLNALFARLGVAQQDGQIIFDDHAPLAEVRRLITAPPLDSSAAGSSSFEGSRQ